MKITMVFVSLMLLSGCGAKKIAVNHADTLISSQITNRLPLNSQQKEDLKGDVENFLEKNKPLAQEILPVVDNLDLSHEDKLEQQYKKFEDFYLKLSDRFSLLISKHMAKLNPEQQKDFFSTLNDENRAMVEKDKDDLNESVLDRWEKFVGPLSDKQKKIILGYSDYFYEKNLERVKQRKKLQEEFKSIYGKDSSRETKQKQFHEAFNQYQTDSLKGSKSTEIMKKIFPTLSKDQKEHLRGVAQEVHEMLSYYLSVDY